MKLTKVAATAVLTATLMTGVGMSAAGATSRSTVRDGLSTLTSDISDMTSAAQSYDTDALESACQSMQVDASDVLTYSRPGGVPRRAWRLLRQAMYLEVSAGEQCEIGARDLDADAISLATDYLDQGTAKLNAAAAAM